MNCKTRQSESADIPLQTGKLAFNWDSSTEYRNRTCYSALRLPGKHETVETKIQNDTKQQKA
jgi:hypothetical protein